MKTLFTFLVQLFIVGGLIKLAVRIFVPRTIRFFLQDIFNKSSVALTKSIYTIIEDIKKDVNSNTIEDIIDDVDDIVVEDEVDEVNYEEEYSNVINFRQKK